jgi:hypothetical protein
VGVAIGVAAEATAAGLNVAAIMTSFGGGLPNARTVCAMVVDEPTV